MHRDLKPSNILVNEAKGIVKLADFGLACVFEDSKRDYTHEVVTMWYRPPELLLSRWTNYSFEIDIWSSGCIFAEMAIGKVLFKGDSEFDQSDKINDLLEEPVCETSFSFLFFSPQIDKDKLKSRINDKLNPSGFELLTNMLKYAPEKRIKAKDILEHDYFKETRF